MNDRDLSADQKYYASKQPSVIQPSSDKNRTRPKQASRRPMNNGVDSTDKYYANAVEYTLVREESTLPAVTGETDSISDVSDIVRVLDTVSVLFSTGTTSVRVPVMESLAQRARTNLELRVGREELTFDQAASVSFVLLDTTPPVVEEEPEAVAEPEPAVEVAEEEDNDLACPKCGMERDQIGTDPADMIYICPKCDDVEDPEEVEDAPTSEDLLEALNEDDTPSIASLFGATDDDDDGDD